MGAINREWGGNELERLLGKNQRKNEAFNDGK